MMTSTCRTNTVDEMVQEAKRLTDSDSDSEEVEQQLPRVGHEHVLSP